VHAGAHAHFWFVHDSFGPHEVPVVSRVQPEVSICVVATGEQAPEEHVGVATERERLPELSQAAA
jgi:hypothetical protein